MKTSELIEVLARMIQKHGDLEVFTNGEHGINESGPLTISQVSVGEASLMFDTDHLDIDDSEIVVHIGGY